LTIRQFTIYYLRSREQGAGRKEIVNFQSKIRNKK